MFSGPVGCPRFFCRTIKWFYENGRIEMKNSMWIFAAAALFVTGAIANADPVSYSTNFDSMSPGSIVGQEGWSNPGGGTYDQSVTAGVGLLGSQAWKLSNDVTNGAVETIVTPTFAGIGESNTVFGGTPAYNDFSETFWFRTVSTSDDPDLYISNSLGAAASVRNTWVGIQDDGSGNLVVDAFGTDSAGNFTENPSTGPLVWGDWYEVKVNALFVNGADNDQVNYQVLDSGGNTLLNATINSWETYYTNNPSAEDAPGPIESNLVSWGLGDNSPTAQGVYIDDLSLSVSSVPLPASAWSGLALLGGLGLLGGIKHLLKQTA
jgi:hypothetical protein